MIFRQSAATRATTRTTKLLAYYCYCCCYNYVVVILVVILIINRQPILINADDDEYNNFHFDGLLLIPVSSLSVVVVPKRTTTIIRKSRFVSYVSHQPPPPQQQYRRPFVQLREDEQLQQSFQRWNYSPLRDTSNHHDVWCLRSSSSSNSPEPTVVVAADSSSSSVSPSVELDNEDDENNNNRRTNNDDNNRLIAIEWLQKFQFLLTISSLHNRTNNITESNSSSRNSNNRKMIQDMIHQVFVHAADKPDSSTTTSYTTDDGNYGSGSSMSDSSIDDGGGGGSGGASTTIQTVPFWRDMIALTWNIITLEGPIDIANFLLRRSVQNNHHHNKKDQDHDSVGMTTSQWKIDESKDIVQTMVPTTTSTTTANTAAANEEYEQLEFWLTFHTNIGVGRAHVRLLRQPPPPQQEELPIAIRELSTLSDDDDDSVGNEWKAHTLLTTLQSLHDRPWNNAPYHRSMSGNPMTIMNKNSQQQQQQNMPIPNRMYWHEQQQRRQQQDRETPYVVIIGGGQGGLSLAARLQYLNIPYVVYEMGRSVGTSWTLHRYPSLYLHDPVYYNHLPYLEFPKTWPLFCPRNKIANFLRCYVELLDLNVVCSTKVVRAVQDGTTKLWWLDIEQRSYRKNTSSNHNDIVNTDNDDTVTTTKSTIQCHHIVFATGNSSHPRRRSTRNTNNDQKLMIGEVQLQQIHSSQYKGGKECIGKRHIIVIGSNNSAFDICQDLWEQSSTKNGGAVETITMIQRTPGMIVSTQSVLQFGLGPLYAEMAALHHEEADIVATTMPYKLALLTKWKRVTQLMEQIDAQLLQDLRTAGYRVDNGPNGTGIFAKSASEGGGFYIDHGCAELIIRNDVSVRFATVIESDRSSLRIQYIDEPSRTETLPADLVIHATGFDTMDRYVEEICGTDISHRVGRTWGLGLGHNIKKDPNPWEGELRNMWKPTNVDGLWFQGGNLAQNRHYSKYLALQLAARYMGIDVKVFGIPKPTPPNRNG